MPHDRPFALVIAGAHGQVISAANSQAKAGGVEIGRSLADARAALPGLTTRPAEPGRDRAALRALAHWAGRYGPARNVHGDDGLWIDITSVSHLFGGETGLMDDLAGRLARIGLAARAGLADTFGAAFALARFATTPHRPYAVAPVGEAASRLADLPVAGLRLSAAAVLLLKRLGLRRIGQLYEIAPALLEHRFRDLVPVAKGHRTGPVDVAAVVRRLHQALGRAEEPRAALVEPPLHLARRLFAEPLISADGVATAVGDLAVDLARRLEEAGEGARRLRLALYRADGTVATVEAGTSAPCRDATHIFKLLSVPLESIDAGFGIDAIVLEATVVERAPARQPALAACLTGGRRSPSLLLDRLSNRLGPDRVLRLHPSDSHIPQRSEMHVPALGRVPDPWPAARSERPALLLAPPELITVMAEIPEGPPARFSWRRVSHRIARAEGPERIEPEWWRHLFMGGVEQAPSRTRDYYRIEDDHGARFWVFREGLYQAEDGPPAWYVHGLFG